MKNIDGVYKYVPKVILINDDKPNPVIPVDIKKNFNSFDNYSYLNSQNKQIPVNYI